MWYISKIKVYLNMPVTQVELGSKVQTANTDFIMSRKLQVQRLHWTDGFDAV